MRETLDVLFAHLEWADRRTLDGLRTLPSPSQKAIVWMAHILAAEHLWLSRIHGVPARVAVWPELDIDECEALAGDTHAAFAGLLATLDDGALERVVRYVSSQGDTYDSRLADILLHVAMHGQYHRGQVAAAIRSGGGTPQATDFIVYTRGDPVT